jgi:mannosyltransferase
MGVYQSLLHVWMWIGQSEFWIRALSVIFGVASVGSVAVLGNRLFNRPTGLIASFMVAINVFHIQYSQEARAYSLVTLLVTVATILLVKAVQESKRWHWLLYSLTAILAIYSHAFAILVVFAHVVYLLLYHLKTLLSKRVLASYISIAAFSMPLVYALYLRAKDPFVPLDWLHKLSIHEVSDLFSSLAGKAEYAGSPGAKILVACYLIVGIIAFAAWLRMSLVSWRSREATSLGLLLLWLFTPIVLLVSLSTVRPIVVNRYFLICLPALALTAAYALTIIKRKWVPICLLLVLMGSSTLHMVAYYRYRLGDGEWKSATRHVLAEANAGDAIFFVVAPGRILFDYYQHRYNELSNPAPEIVYPETTDIRKDPSALRYLPELREELVQSAIRHHARVWVVLYHDQWPATRPVSSRLVDSMSSVYRGRQEQKFNQVTVLLFSDRSPAARALPE